VTVFVIGAGLPTAWRAVTWASSWGGRSTALRYIGDPVATPQSVIVVAAETRPRGLAPSWRCSRPEGDPVAHLDVGVVLLAGETPWAYGRARLATW